MKDGQGELPVHTVYISTFYIDKYEVTQALWDEVKFWAVTNGYTFDNEGLGKAPNHPVYSMNWYDAVKWCNARSEKEARVPAYYTSTLMNQVYRTGRINLRSDWVRWNNGYRLPTEAEWEKAARGGASGHRFPWSDVDTISHSQANYASGYNFVYDISPTRGYHPDYASGGHPYTSPVGSFAPNGYGLYDMAGNVYERCWDTFGSYTSAAQTDPRSLFGGRIIRGGGWSSSAVTVRCAYRDNQDQKYPDNAGGFRTVLAPSQ